MNRQFTYNQYKYFIFGILATAYILVYFHRLCAAVVAVDMMNDFKTGGALMGLLGAAYYYPYAAMQIPAGLLSDSWGPRRTITLFFIIACLGSLIQGMAPAVAWAIIGRTLVGVGVAMLFVPTMKILAEWFRAKEFATMTGVLVAMGGLGTLIATSPLAVLSDAVGWRFSFVIIGIITMVCAILVWLVVRDRPVQAGFDVVTHEDPSDHNIISLREGVNQVVAHPGFWAISVWFFFECAIFFSFGGLWGGPYLMQVYGLTKTEAGNILSMLAVGMIIGSPAHGYISNKIVGARKPVILFSSIMTLMVTAFLSFDTGGLPIPVLYLLSLGLGIFANAIVVVGFTATKELFPVQIAGTSTGLVNLFPFLGGALAQPFLGYLLERRGRMAESFTVEGYQDAFFALFVFALIALAAALFIEETMKRNPDN